MALTSNNLNATLKEAADLVIFARGYNGGPSVLFCPGSSISAFMTSPVEVTELGTTTRKVCCQGNMVTNIVHASDRTDILKSKIQKAELPVVHTILSRTPKRAHEHFVPQEKLLTQFFIWRCLILKRRIARVRPDIKPHGIRSCQLPYPEQHPRGAPITYSPDIASRDIFVPLAEEIAEGIAMGDGEEHPS
ncbi:hypothetical protein J6590_032345 [Homalodisca vitripennis]|nr:hypothetical protein J6590_032345 [Homalodisca vitripennis]